MIEVTCSTQVEIEACIKAQNIAVIAAGAFALVISGADTPKFILKGTAFLSIVARESSQPSIVAWGSSQPSIEAWESSQPSIEAWESSQPSIVAWGSSQPSIVARGSSQPRIVAWGSSQPSIVASINCQLNIRGNVTGKAHAKTAINYWSKKGKIKGGRALVIDLSNPAKWCDYYGVEVEAGKALLFKGVAATFKSERGGDYTPGTIPVCPDWDGGKIECGHGYHVSPAPAMTKEFCTPQKFVAGWVKLSDMAVHPDGDYPQKCKIHKYAAPVWECDIDGNPVTAKASQP